MRAPSGKRIANVELDGSDIHRIHVTWEGGGEVWVNRGDSVWRAAEHELLQYGFYAIIGQGPAQVEAGIELRNGLVVEWSAGTAW